MAGILVILTTPVILIIDRRLQHGNVLPIKTCWRKIYLFLLVVRLTRLPVMLYMLHLGVPIRMLSRRTQTRPLRRHEGNARVMNRKN